MLDNPARRMTQDPRPSAQSIGTRYRSWRAHMVGSPRFRALVKRIPVLRWYADRQARTLFSITTGFVQSQVLLACLETGALKAAAHGGITAQALMAATQLPAAGFHTLLQAADALGILHCDGNGMVTLGDLGAVVNSDPGLCAMIRHHAALYRDLADPVALLRGTAPETEMRHLWSYAGDGRNAFGKDSAATYSTLMAASQTMLVHEIIDSYDFSRHAAVLDIGGGEGVFVRALAERYPQLRLGIFDLPQVIEHAAGVIALSPHRDRIRLFAGSFFTDTIPQDHDCVTLVRVVFDHDDRSAVALLSRIRAAMRPGDRLVIAEPMAGTSAGERISAAYFAFYFLAMGSGRCRTPAEISDLVRRAGFSQADSRPCRTPMLASMVVARA